MLLLTTDIQYLWGSEQWVSILNKVFETILTDVLAYQQCLIEPVTGCVRYEAVWVQISRPGSSSFGGVFHFSSIQFFLYEAPNHNSHFNVYIVS